MFGYRGRGGPSRGTPASVQCQKCLKRGHYSYECKASAQERPYVSRPSRSQQLRNPKLAPKLESDKLEVLEKKKGIADEEIAKLEAERARKRELEDRDDDMLRSAPKRQRSRSASSESVSTISTRSSRSPRRRSPSDSRSRSPSPRRGEGVEHRPNRSMSPVPGRQRPSLRDSRSPPRQPAENYRSRDDSPPRRYDGNRTSRRERRFSSVSKGSRDSRPRHRDTSRSPDANRPRHRGDERASEPQRDSRAALQDPGQPRERSLSPFSKRLALTRSRAP
ncbi:zinc knuckle-domain-containing protein [Emericellopsis atlantica]|uniref:Zinc knuckle-domain-containing protein n=1 Tax=Emericellopsis atlantica TaxID=2614577 RepID=A0A9P8CPY2_9HYPO|nr:zinc knuckle-domain-containing protein [Emericellopsis atlantica]KAG9254580.1 zinc knuckle-domain-containing protein [Emericellopsis atlantica]